MPIRIIISDDHPIVRSGIRMSLERESDIEIVGEATDGHQALDLTIALEPDVLVLDIEMPSMTGVEVTRSIRSAHLNTRILILSSYDDKQYIATLLALGADGYLTKDEAHSMIVAAVRGVGNNEQGWFSRRITARMIVNQSKGEATAMLTEREREILSWIIGAKTNQAIAHALQISEKTVERHVSSLFEKLSVTSRVEAAVLAVREQLL